MSEARPRTEPEAAAEQVAASAAAESPTAATFEVAAVEDRARVPLAAVKLAVAAVAVVVMVIGGSNALLPKPVAVLPSAAPRPTSYLRQTQPPPGHSLEPGAFEIVADGVRIALEVPAGWARSDDAMAVYKTGGGGGYGNTNEPSLSVHEVFAVSPHACQMSLLTDARVPAGRNARDLETSLVTLAGPDAAPPADVSLNGYPARRLDLTGILEPCRSGPEGRILWQDANGSYFGMLTDATAAVYILDVDGRGLVIATHERGSSPTELAELGAIVASITVEAADD